MAGWGDPAHRLDAERLKNLFREVDWQIGLRSSPGSEPTNLIVCGGAAMCCLDSNRGTGDVDIISPPMPSVVREAVKTISKRRGLGPGWMNDAPTSFADYSRVPAPNVLYDGTHLKVLAPDRHYLLGMKVQASRDVDLPDIIWLMEDLGIKDKRSLYEAAEMVGRSIKREWAPRKHHRKMVNNAVRQMRQRAKQSPN